MGILFPYLLTHLHIKPSAKTEGFLFLVFSVVFSNTFTSIKINIVPMTLVFVFRVGLLFAMELNIKTVQICIRGPRLHISFCWQYLLHVFPGQLPTKKFLRSRVNFVKNIRRIASHLLSENSFTCLPASIVSAIM